MIRLHCKENSSLPPRKYFTTAPNRNEFNEFKEKLTHNSATFSPSTAATDGKGAIPPRTLRIIVKYKEKPILHTPLFFFFTSNHRTAKPDINISNTTKPPQIIYLKKTPSNSLWLFIYSIEHYTIRMYVNMWIWRNRSAAVLVWGEIWHRHNVEREGGRKNRGEVLERERV